MRMIFTVMISSYDTQGSGGSRRTQNRLSLNTVTLFVPSHDRPPNGRLHSLCSVSLSKIMVRNLFHGIVV